jgi:uncharacterized protein (TIGR00299 family) protein
VSGHQHAAPVAAAPFAARAGTLFPGASRLLFIDAPSGISGDMFLAGLAGLGFDLATLQAAFARAGVTLGLGTEAVTRNHLAGLHLRAELPHEHAHRALDDCLDLVARLELPAPAAELAARCFRRLAEVEAALHATTPDRVHFHEVGAMDSLLDIAGAAYGLAQLGIGRVYLRELAVGHGTVKTAHGVLPLPAPATLALLQGFPLREVDAEFELVTPTGALILAETAEPAPAGLRWRPLATAYGAGTKEIPGRPNLLRLTLAEALPAPGADGLLHRELPLLRCTVDDMSAERCGYLMERLFEAGALDVHFRPLQMKKNRPGIEIEVLASEDAAQLGRLQDLLFTETSTLGLRIAREERVELPRHFERVTTPFGEVSMKVAQLPGGARRAAPEYEDCARLARASGRPLMEIEEAARRAWAQHKDDDDEEGSR